MEETTKRIKEVARLRSGVDSHITLDYVESYVSRLKLIDKMYSADIAKKKKDDLRKLIYTSHNEEKRDAFKIAWEKHFLGKGTS